MSDDKNLDTSSAPTPEELKQEEAALAESKEEEVRSKVIEELGLDETVDAELIAKLTSERLQHKKELSTAIRQKQGWRTKAQKPAEQKPPAEPAKPASPPEQVDVDKKINDALNERDLKALDLSDELKDEIKTLAKVKGISYIEASKQPYILHLKEEEERKALIDKASIKPGQKGQAAAKTFPKGTTAKDFDPNTPEGREGLKAFLEQTR